jgi:hypothetical protein
MPAESINSEMFLLVIGALPILVTIVSLDRYLARRRGFSANAEYVARIQSSRENSGLHQRGRLGWANWQSDGPNLGNLTWAPEIELSAPGFFSRRRRISDRFGRVVATHYEEFVRADRFDDMPLTDVTNLVCPPLMLASGKV